MAKPPIIDAEFEVISPPREPAWRAISRDLSGVVAAVLILAVLIHLGGNADPESNAYMFLKVMAAGVLLSGLKALWSLVRGLLGRGG